MIKKEEGGFEFYFKASSSFHYETLWSKSHLFTVMRSILLLSTPKKADLFRTLINLINPMLLSEFLYFFISSMLVNVM